LKKNLALTDSEALKLEFMSVVGQTLLQIQMTEQALKRLATQFLRVKDMPWEQILASNEKERRKTLGYFLRELRKNTPVRSDFDKTLTEFLEARNLFVHNFASVPNFSLNDDAGIEAGLDFVRTLNHQTVFIRNIFMGLIRIMMGEDNLKDGIGPDVTEDQINELTAIGAFLQSDYWEDEDK